MTTRTPIAQGLTISDLSRRTGLTPATLRAWEARYGFPVPARRASGHRRYDGKDVSLIEEVLRRRATGVRLEVAIAEVAAARAVVSSPAPSVFAALRRAHPNLAPQRLSKATLLALTWAMEDECCARAQRPVLFAAFQEERFLRQSRSRWQELARTARSTVVFADFDGAGGSPEITPGVDAIHLPVEDPMRREWSLVCDAPEHAAALSAWELPGQHDVPDRDRIFESVWTLEPRAVRDAARVFAQLTDALDPGVDRDWSALEPIPPASSEDLRAGTGVFQRLIAYVDHGRR